jgi:hypothetical protein
MADADTSILGPVGAFIAPNADNRDRSGVWIVLGKPALARLNFEHE